MIENQSGLLPLGRAVLVRMLETSQHKGMIEIPDLVKERSAVMEQRAEVVAVGQAAWTDEPVPRCEPGDKVIITRLAGYVARGPKDGQLYRLVNDRDIFCKVLEEGHG